MPSDDKQKNIYSAKVSAKIMFANKPEATHDELITEASLFRESYLLNRIKFSELTECRYHDDDNLRLVDIFQSGVQVTLTPTS